MLSFARRDSLEKKVIITKEGGTEMDEKKYTKGEVDALVEKAVEKYAAENKADKDPLYMTHEQAVEKLGKNSMPMKFLGCQRRYRLPRRVCRRGTKEGVRALVMISLLKHGKQLLLPCLLNRFIEWASARVDALLAVRYDTPAPPSPLLADICLAFALWQIVADRGGLAEMPGYVQIPYDEAAKLLDRLGTGTMALPGVLRPSTGAAAGLPSPPIR